MESIKHNELIADRIRHLAAEKNLSANRIATLAGLTQSTVNNIFNGHSKNPTIDTINRISNALEISVVDFLDIEPYNIRPNEPQTEEEIIDYLNSLSKEISRMQKKIQKKD